MADFCNVCSHELFGADIEPEIDVYAILENNLKPGYYIQVLCEGCGMSHVGKDDVGDPFLYFDYEDPSAEKVSLQEWEEGKRKLF